MGEDRAPGKQSISGAPHRGRDARPAQRVPRDPARGYRGTMTELAIYDLDKTITRKPTYNGFLWHAALALAPWRLALAPLLLGPLAAYWLRRIDRGRLKEWSHAILLGPHLSPAELAAPVKAFAAHTVARNARPGALTRIEEDRAAGRRLVLATASYRLYTTGIAERLGFDAVVATNSIAGLDGRLRPRIDGENCYGAAKLRMIQAWMTASGLDRADCRIRFYSDHATDAPVFKWADEAYAVNPHPPLRAMARARGWEVFDWG